MKLKKIMAKGFRVATYIPLVNSYIKKEGDKTIGEFVKKF